MERMVSGLVKWAWDHKVLLLMTLGAAGLLALGLDPAEAHRSTVYHWHHVEAYPGYWLDCLYSPAGSLVFCR